MPLINSLKPVVDLPVWEWLRFAPSTPTSVSTLVTSNAGASTRYIYYQVSGSLFRYDTIADSWNQLSSVPANTPTIMMNNTFANNIGYYGQVISSGTGSNTLQIAGLYGEALVGYKIRILTGTGAGQERTIVDVSDPIIVDRGVCTSASGTTVIDASTGAGLKQWRTNIWKNYQVRLEFGTGRTQIRKILYNTINTLVFSDANHITINPWAQAPLITNTVANTTLYTIEYNDVIVDTPWTTLPDSTSTFVVLSGGLFNLSQGTTTAPFFTLMYYDVISDVWYQKSTQTGLKTAVFTAGSDLAIEKLTETGGPILSASASGAGSRFLTFSSPSLTNMQYANFKIKISAGTGIGQEYTIMSNTSNRINIHDDWAITPDNTSSFEIWRDTDKLLFTGGGDATLFQYSINSDQVTTGRQFTHGQCNQLAAVLYATASNRYGGRPIALTSITRVSTSMITAGSVSLAGTGYNIDDILTVGGGTGGTVRVTAIDRATGGVVSVLLEQCGSGYTTGAKSTTVTPSGGSGCQITLSGSDIDFTEQAVTPIAHNFKIGDVVVISGASGTGASKFNGTYSIIGNSTNNLSFNYCSVSDPGAASATIANSPSATQIVDCTKNWIVNEHVGKIVQLATNAVYSTGQTRRIVSNTATTLVWTLAATAPVNGTTRYVIHDSKIFGTDTTLGAQIGGGNSGFATSGTSASITDTTKNWKTNYWSKTANRKVRILEGTGVGSELSITSNTSNTLFFTPQSFTIDTTSRYVIMDAFGLASSGTTTTLVDSTQNWDVNCWAGKRVKFLSGNSAGNEYTITGNTASTLTFALGTAPDTSTSYCILKGNPKTNGVSLINIIGSSASNLNNKYFYSFVGTTTPQLERFDYTTETWGLMSYFPQSENLAQGSMYAYDGVDRIYFWSSSGARLMYYDLVKNIVVPSSTPPYGMSTLISSNRMEIVTTSDGLKYLYLMRHSGTEFWRCLLFW